MVNHINYIHNATSNIIFRKIGFLSFTNEPLNNWLYSPSYSDRGQLIKNTKERYRPVIAGNEGWTCLPLLKA